MRPRSSRLLLLSLLLLAASGSRPAQAQAPVAANLERLEVAMWPEYDRPEVLVMYRAELSAQTPLPATVELPVPAAIGKPHAVAKRGDNNNLYDADFVRVVVSDDTALIRINTDVRRVQLEYYAPLEIAGEKRSFTFAWPGGPAIAKLDYEVQQPTGAEGLVIAPAPTAKASGVKGLIHHGASLGAVAAGAKTSIQISYTKKSAELSAKPPPPAMRSSAPAAPPAPTPATTAPPPPPPASGSGMGLAWPVALALLLLAALAYGVQQTYATDGTTRLDRRRPGFYGGIGGMAAGIVITGFGAWTLATHGDSMMLGIALLSLGLIESAVSYYSLRKSRVAWGFALSLHGTAFVIFLVGAPKLRDALDLPGIASLLPSVYLLAMAILLYASADDYE